MPHSQQVDGQALLQRLRQWAHELGFSQIGVAGIDLRAAEAGLLAWLEAGFHGRMAYMAAHGLKRARPAELVPGTLSVITARMDYLPRGTPAGDWQAVEWQGLARPRQAQVSVYARGRDYHKVLRQRLQALADRLQAELGPRGHRVFTDSAPVLEVELATRSGLGWRGKHTLTLSREAGSMFFLGELFVDLALPPDAPAEAHCGRCSACIDVCPTRAIVAPYRLDARRCISYLTIEHDGSIPTELREAIGNRVYGCDDCQLVCPWNKFAQTSPLPDFDPRNGLQSASLLGLWAWTETEFDQRLAGGPIRRIGWQRWRRNLAVAMGNAWRATADPALRQALAAARDGADELVREHIDWALSAA
ncbi:MAG: tRNA epoxyqueuosine(34) reductase QueG [Rubrivivax sp.]